MGFIKPTFKDWILDFQFKSIFFYKWHICILLGMYIVAFFIGFLFWKSCKFLKEAQGLGLYLKVGGRLHFVLFHKFICGNSWKKGVRHHDFYSELVLRGVGHGYFYFILAGLLPPLVAPHGDVWWQEKVAATLMPECRNGDILNLIPLKCY